MDMSSMTMVGLAVALLVAAALLVVVGMLVARWMAGRG